MYTSLRDVQRIYSFNLQGNGPSAATAIAAATQKLNYIILSWNDNPQDDTFII